VHNKKEREQRKLKGMKEEKQKTLQTRKEQREKKGKKEYKKIWDEKNIDDGTINNERSKQIKTKVKEIILQC
jgi:hypothetical protein